MASGVQTPTHLPSMQTPFLHAELGVHTPSSPQVRGTWPSHDIVSGIHSPVHWPAPLHTKGHAVNSSQMPVGLHLCGVALSQIISPG